MDGRYDYWMDVLSKCQSVGDLWQATQAWSSNNSKMTCYLHIPPLGATDYCEMIAVFVNGFPRRFATEYIDNRYYLHDPALEHVQTSTKPQWWSSVLKSTTLTSRQQHVVDTLVSYDVGEGLTVPVFGPGNRNGWCSLGLGHNPPRLSSGEMIRIQALCNAVHLKYIELETRIQDIYDLSHREIQTMRLITHGMTATEIAKEMNISVNTVHTNTRRAYEKLDVNDKVSATHRFMAAGYYYYAP